MNISAALYLLNKYTHLGIVCTNLALLEAPLSFYVCLVIQINESKSVPDNISGSGINGKL